MRSVAQTSNRYAGSRWLQVGGVAVLFAVLFHVLLEALLDAEELSERTVVELTWRDMRVGLQIAKGEALIARRDAEIAGWIGANPVRWLQRPPEGYQGDCALGGTAVLEAGAWCFDQARRELVYRPRNARYLKLSTEHAGPKILRWRVSLPPGEVVQPGPVPGLRVEIVTPYVWREE